MKLKLILIILGITILLGLFIYIKVSPSNSRSQKEEFANEKRLITVLGTGGGVSCPEGTEFVKTIESGTEGSLLCRLLLKGNDFITYALINTINGLSKSEVKDILGEPDDVSNENLGQSLSECWTYNEGAGYMVCFDNSKPFEKVAYSSGLTLG